MKTLSMPYTESQITFDLSGHQHFAFENCAGYQQISHHQLSEMDIGWYEPNDQTLYIAELKDYSVWLQAAKPPPGDRAARLFHKSLAVIAMLTAVRAGSPVGQTIASCLPPAWPNTSAIRLLHIIHCQPQDEIKLSFLKKKLDEYMNRQYLALFNIDSCVILSHRQAVERFPNIIS